MTVWRADRARTSQAELTVDRGSTCNGTVTGVSELYMPGHAYGGPGNACRTYGGPPCLPLAIHARPADQVGGPAVLPHP